MTSTADPVLIFDLDGTIIDVNSFPIWVGAMLRGRIPDIGAGRRASVSLRAAVALAQRKIFRQDHAVFKAQLQQIWAGATGRNDACCETIIAHLMVRVRPNLLSVLNEVSGGNVDAVLTTAAAAEYALPLARRLGFRHAIATPPAGSTDRTENVGTAKRDRTLAYLDARGWANRPRIFFTDHRDDLPLMRECRTIIWLGPDAECAQVCGPLAGIDVVAARALEADVTYAHALGWRIGTPSAAVERQFEIRACT